MGDMKFTVTQQKAFDSIASNSTIKENFYFTGGTALSIFYLQHRISDDLDFFTESDISVDFTNPLITLIAEKLKLSVRFTQIENTLIYEFTDSHTMKLKIDFAKYPYKRLEKGPLCHGVMVDSLLDIGANKIAAINNRNDIKDFVDCYFILKHYTLWDLLRAYEHKFGMEVDLVLFASNVLKVEDFDYLPKMIIKITLQELKQYFLELTDRIGKRITE